MATSIRSYKVLHTYIQQFNYNSSLCGFIAIVLAKLNCMGELIFKDNLMYGNVSLCKGEILASNYFSNETSEEEIY